MHNARRGKQSQDLGLGLCHGLLPGAFQATPPSATCHDRASQDVDTSKDTLPLPASLATSVSIKCVHPMLTCQTCISPLQRVPIFHDNQPHLLKKAPLTASGASAPVYKFPSPAVSLSSWLVPPLQPVCKQITPMEYPTRAQKTWNFS